MSDSDARPPWQHLFRAANEHFTAEDFEPALPIYDGAMRAIDALLEAGAIELTLVVSKLIVLRNRAGALARLARFHEACAAYRIAHAFAEAVAQDALLAKHLRQAARGHARAILAAWQDCSAELIRPLHSDDTAPLGACPTVRHARSVVIH